MNGNIAPKSTKLVKVLFRVSEDQQPLLHLGVEAVAVFRMLKDPKRDVFEFSDGRQLTVDELPPGMIFDVLMVPGLEHLSAFLDSEPVAQEQEQEEQQKEKESFLTRLMARL